MVRSTVIQGLVVLLTSFLTLGVAVSIPVSARSVSSPNHARQDNAVLAAAANTLKARDEAPVLQTRGIASSQARLLLLLSRKSDLELQLQFINQSRNQIANALNSSNLTGDQRNALTDRDRALAAQAAQIQAQLNAVTAEIESVNRLLVPPEP